MGLTLPQIRERLGIELRAFRQGTASSGSTLHTLVDTAHPFRTNRLDGDAYADFTGWHMFRPDAVTLDDVERRVLLYDGPTGTFQPDLQYAVSPSGESFELWNVGLSFDEINDSINQSLTRLSRPYRFWLVPPSDSQRASFGRVYIPSDTGGWLTSQKQILAIGYLTEGPKNTSSMEVSILSAKDYAGAVLTFKRDRYKESIQRVQWASDSDEGVTSLTAVLPQAPTVGNLLVMVASAYGGAIATPSGWTAGPAASKNNVRIATFYRFVTQTIIASQSTAFTGGGSGSAITVIEYSGLLPGGIDVTTTTTGNSATLASGTTSVLAQGDELCIAAIAANYAAAQFNPTNRFNLVSNPHDPTLTDLPAFHGVYERLMPISDLQDRTPNRVDARVPDPVQEEQGQVFISPLQAIAPPSFYVIEARRSLYTLCRTDSTGMFGTKTDGLTEEDNEVAGEGSDLLEAIVAGAMVYAWERYPNFKSLSDRELERKILKARERFISFLKATQSRLRHQLKYREPIGGW